MKRKKSPQVEKRLKHPIFCPWCGQKVSCVTEVFSVHVHYVTYDGDLHSGRHGEVLFPRQKGEPVFSGIEVYCNDCRKSVVLDGIPSLDAITTEGARQ
jgi:hypothetical protein